MNKEAMILKSDAAGRVFGPVERGMGGVTGFWRRRVVGLVDI
jgi:hypothetical protein